MTALDTVRRKRTTIMLATSLAMLMLLAGFGYAGYKALRRYEGAKKVDNVREPIPDAPVAMLATVDDANALTTVSLIVLRSHGALGGTLVPVPVSVDSTYGAGDERIPLTEVYATGGVEELKAAIENTVGITLDLAQAATPAETEALLAGLSQISVEFPSAVGELFPVGPATLTPNQAVQALNSHPEGTTDRQRRPNIEAVWSGVGRAATAAPVPLETPLSVDEDGNAPDPTSLTEVFGRLLSGTVDSRPLGAIVFDAERNPTGEDVEQVDLADAVMVLATIAPRSMATPAAGLTFLIEAPAGSESRVLQAVKMLQFFDCNVKFIRFVNGPVPDETIFLVTQQSIQQQAEDSGAVEPFGAAHFEVTNDPIEDIDVIMRLGAAFLNGTGGVPTSLPTASTTPGSTVASTAPTTSGA